MTLKQEILDELSAILYLKMYAVTIQSYEIASSLRDLEKTVYERCSIKESDRGEGSIPPHGIEYIKGPNPGEYRINPGIERFTTNQFLHISKVIYYLELHYKNESSFVSFKNKILSLISIEMRDRKINDILS